MPVAVIDRVTSKGTTAASPGSGITPAMPTRIAGDLLLQWITTDGTVTISTPAGWTAVYPSTTSGTTTSAVTRILLARIATGDAADDFTTAPIIAEDYVTRGLSIRGHGAQDLSRLKVTANALTTAAMNAASIDMTGTGSNRRWLLLALGAQRSGVAAEQPTAVTGYLNFWADSTGTALANAAAESAESEITFAGIPTTVPAATFTGRTGTGQWVSLHVAVPEPAPPSTGVVAQAFSMMSQSAAGTRTLPVFAGTAAQAMPAMSQAAAGTRTLPVFTGAVAQDLPALGQSASGESAPPVFAGAADQIFPALEQEASGTRTVPVFEGGVEQTMGALAQQADAAASAPVFEAVADQVMPALEQAVTAVAPVGPDPDWPCEADVEAEPYGTAVGAEASGATVAAEPYGASLSAASYGAAVLALAYGVEVKAEPYGAEVEHEECL